MLLRTKILAAIVGLNLAALLVPVAILVFARREDRGADVPAAVLSALLRAQAPDVPEKGTRAQALAALAGTEGVEEAVFLEQGTEDPDAGVVRRPLLPDDPAPPPPSDRAVALFREALQRGRPQVLDGELALKLETERSPPYQGLYVRWRPGPEASEGIRDVYLFLLAGIVIQSVLAWGLLSRLLVVPLRRLASAADRIAAGDHQARVVTTGSGDEFDRTAAAFNRMAGDVGEYQAQLEDRVLQALGRIRKTEQHLAIAQRLAATGTLASGIAHEINNPLGGMRNAVKALARGDLEPAKTAEYLALVLDGLGRIEETVKKVLSFTPRGGSPRSTDLAEVARKAIAFARHRAERRGVEIVERLPAREVRVFGDPHELQQVALNLVLNALDAIPAPGERERGAGRVDVSVEEEADAVVLRVSDDGVGMSPEVQAQCFDLFFTTKEVGEGTGLGLAVVHTIVTNHGGRIEVESAPARGTTFRVVLPREPAPAEAEGAVRGR